VTSNQSLHATFAIDRYAWSVASVHGGSDPASGVYTNDYGAALTVSLTNSPVYAGELATQYVATGWAGTGSATNGAGTNTAFTLTNDSAVAWQWVTNVWLDTGATSNGTVTPADGWFELGSTATVEALPDTGYHFAGWTGDVPPAQTNDNPLALAMDAPRAVTADFAVNEYTITATWTGGGYVDPSMAVVEHGGEVVFTIVPDENYQVVDVEVNGMSVGATNAHRFSMVTSNQTLYAVFALLTHQLVLTSEHGGSDPAAGVYTNEHGTEITVTLTNSPVFAGELSTQYVATGWVGSGSVDDGLGTNTTFALKRDSSLTWQWSTNVWLDTGATSNGTVTPVDGWFELGSTATVEALPDSGYHFAGWTGDVAPAQTNDNPLALAMDAPRAVTANFAMND
jgi:hypothetical protein